MPGPGRFATWVNSIFSGRLLLTWFPLWSNSHATSADAGTCRIHSSRVLSRRAQQPFLFFPISLKFQSGLRFCFLHESSRRLSNRPTGCEWCQLSGAVKVSVTRWLLFCPHHTAHPLVWIPGTRHHRSGPVAGWPRGLTPEVPFTSLTAASFYSTENQNCALLPNSSQA